MAPIGRHTTLLICLESLLLLQQTYHCLGWVSSVGSSGPCNRLAANGSHPRIKSSALSLSLDPGYPIRFLGRGERAIVRPGVVLLAPREEYHHFLRQAAVFVYGMGYDDHDVYVIRGAIIDHPTPFTLEEMRQHDETSGTCQLNKNLLYRGGDVGGKSVFMLHSDESLAQSTGNEMIGSSGIYEGGFESALAGNQDKIDPEKFKFFFNYMEFTEKELENMLSDPQEDGDAWISVEVSNY